MELQLLAVRVPLQQQVDDAWDDKEGNEEIEAF
jgi:hypothetical protein